MRKETIKETVQLDASFIHLEARIFVKRIDLIIQLFISEKCISAVCRGWSRGSSKH